MTPSERLKHVKGISRELAKEEWPLIDLTLSQFGLRPDPNWGGGEKETYIINITGTAQDSVLLELAKHLGTASELDTVEPPTFWNQDDARVFISHLATIKEKTTELKDALAKFGIQAFVAHNDIEPTKEWQVEIEAALSTMDALVALLSPGFNESKWCDQEVGVAIGRRVPVVPVKIELDPYGLFGKYQAIQAKGENPTDVTPLIVEALIKKPQIGPKITTRLVGQLAASMSWGNSKRLMAMAITKGSTRVEIILWLCLLIPGLIYSVWRLSSRLEGCPSCGNTSLIPRTSPMAQKFLRENLPEKLVVPVELARPPSRVAQAAGKSLGRLVGRILK